MLIGSATFSRYRAVFSIRPVQPYTCPMPRIRIQLISLALCRFFLTTSSRLVFAFLPTFARGLGVTETRLQASLSSRSLVSILVPFLIPLSEKFGRKPFLYAGMVIFAVGCLTAYAARSLLIFIIALFLTTLAQALYDPMMRTHLGDVVPYEQRGRAVALTEFSWAGAMLVGAPIAGVLINLMGWSSPFVWLGAFGLLGLLLIWRNIPDLGRDAGLSNDVDFGAILRALRTLPELWGASVYVFCIMLGNIMMFGSYAGWMERQFDVELSGLGVAAMVIGLAELLGEAVAGWSSDRFGKRRMVLLSAGASVFFNVALPFAENSFVLASVLLFGLFVSFEMSFICVVPIFTEVMPEARSVPLAMLAIAPPIGRSLGLLLVGVIATAGGFQLVGIVAGGLALLGTLVFGRYVQDRR